MRSIEGVAISRFQHTAARRRLGFVTKSRKLLHWFQHTAARRRLAKGGVPCAKKAMFQHTAARRRLAGICVIKIISTPVSTHSRPKAAGGRNAKNRRPKYCFNTQPPEGGWTVSPYKSKSHSVSTHSRPKAAGSLV